MARQSDKKDMAGDLEKQIRRFLKSKGCMLVETKNISIFFVKEGFWGAIEVKKSKNAKVQPGQKENVEKMNEWSWARIVYPENWEEAKAELEEML